MPHRRPVALHALQELHILLDHMLIRPKYFVAYQHTLIRRRDPLIWLCDLGSCVIQPNSCFILLMVCLLGMVYLHLKLALEVSS